MTALSELPDQAFLNFSASKHVDAQTLSRPETQIHGFHSHEIVKYSVYPGLKNRSGIRNNWARIFPLALYLTEHITTLELR